MTLRTTIAAIASSVTSLVLAAGTAHAITLPDSGSCADSRGDCLRITNTATTGGVALRGVGSSAAVGVVGASTSSTGVSGGSTSGFGVWGSSSSSYGVYATSTSGVGLYASSNTANGVIAKNNNTNWNAAALSALSGGAGGLALWTDGDIIVNGNAFTYGTLAWQNPSDARIKKDIAPLRLGLTQLKDIRPVTYKYNGLAGSPSDGREFVGVIAQELEKVLPNMVSTKKMKLHPEDTVETDIKIVDPSAFTYLLISSVKEQQAIIDRQEKRIQALERGHGSVAASVFGSNGVEMGLALGLLPLGFMALRRRKAEKLVA
ncbi:MAG TPA: tail fiber domain-containing protein [Polyangiaceae bacterium]|nr:tail fiber domain-containing protein [Polyangiaceae bacterium]